MATTTGVSNAPIHEVLNRSNYQNWRSRMKRYLLIEDLWEVIEATAKPSTLEVDEAEYKAWTKKNDKALYAIQNSCGDDMFSVIREEEKAKSAWEALERVSKLTAGFDEEDSDDMERYMPFMDSVKEGDWDKAKECLGSLDVHNALRVKYSGDEFGHIAFHLAAQQGHAHIVKELVPLMTLEDLKTKNTLGSTALHLAAANGNLNVVKQLVPLMTPEDLKEKTNSGFTALHRATLEGYVDIVKELVLLMGEVKDDLRGDSALHMAVQEGREDIVKELVVLMRREDLTIKNDEGDTALHLAVNKGNAAFVKQLVSLMREEELKIKNGDGCTALHLAFKNGNMPIVKELVTKSGENNASGDDFKCFICFTEYMIRGDWNNASECLRELDDLYSAITTVDPRDEYGDTSLHTVAKQGHLHIVKELLSLLKLREKDLELKTPEDFKTFCSHVELDADENLFLQNVNYVVEQYQKTLFSILEAQNANGRTTLQEAILNGNIDIVSELVPLMRPEGFEIQDASGRTALYEALTQENIDIVRELVPLMRPEGFEVQEESGRTALCEAVLWGNIDIVREMVQLMRPEGFEVQDKNGRTALYQAVLEGNIDIVRLIVPLMRIEGFEVQTVIGRTALYEAVLNGNINIVRELIPLIKPGDFKVQEELSKHMVDRNKTVLGIIKPPDVDLPVFAAYNHGKFELGHYLYSVTPFEFLMPNHGKNGASLITICFRAKYLDLALHLLQRCPILAISETEMDCTAIEELAGMRSAFLTGSRIGFWQKFIYNRIHIEPFKRNNIDEVSIHISKQEDHQRNKIYFTHSVISLYKKLVKGVYKCLGINYLYEMKWIHVRILEVLHYISEMIKEETLSSAQFDIVKRSIFRAVKCGHIELVKQMCQAHPEFVKSIEESRNIFQLAVEYRQHKIYSLIHGLGEKEKQHFGTRSSEYPYTMLHLAGNLSQLSRFNNIRGAALQMQSELQWFKEVEHLVRLEFHEIVNEEGKTPREIFTENHKNLKEEAEKEMKGTATSCTVVAALIVTMMFAAAFTVPGGNKDTGNPILIGDSLFLLFIISDTLSLTASTTAVILFLGILTSRYAEDDFLKRLPTKMMLGLFTLFLSIVTMMVAFCSALTIMLEGRYAWVVTPLIVVAGVPVASFVWVQFPLLIETFKSTYLGMFDKKVEPWVSL